MELSGQRVLVVGLGASGESAALAAIERGAQVWATEASTTPELEARAERLRARGVKVELGKHSFQEVASDLAVVSPGIPPSAAIVQHLKEQGTRTIGEVELAYSLIRHPIIAVTGTNGKTTTTALVARMIEESGRETLAAGNIGTPLIEASSLTSADAVVAAEVSSFQLWNIETFRPSVAIILNLAEDHMDWHGSLDAYARAKARIFENQLAEDVVVYNADDDLVTDLVSSARSRKVPFSSTRPMREGIGLDGDSVIWNGAPIFTTQDVPLAGAAGLEDAMAAAAGVLEFGIELDAVTRALKSFEPLPHRTRAIGHHMGITYIDDSKATNPHAALAALRGLENVVLIAGGRSKGIDLAPLIEAVPPVIAVIAMGEATEELERVFAHAVPVERAADMEDAVRRAHARSITPGSVLLAPACASLDMYENYAERGNAFARAVENLLKREGERRSDGDA